MLTAITAEPRSTPRPDPATTAAGPAWESVLRTRRAGRPGAADLIRLAATDVTSLHQAGLILALARIGGYPCVLIAQDRHGPPPGPAALRQARRGARLATELRLPLVCVIDTPGADLSARAEEDGLASEIAGCLADLTTLPVPTVSLLLGQGAGGAALALLPADRVLAAQHAWLAPLAPEGASAIIYRDTGHAPQLAARQRIRSADLAADGIVDQVIPRDPRRPGQVLPRPRARAAPGARGPGKPGRRHTPGPAPAPLPPPRDLTPPAAVTRAGATRQQAMPPQPVPLSQPQPERPAQTRPTPPWPVTRRHDSSRPARRTSTGKHSLPIRRGCLFRRSCNRPYADHPVMALASGEGPSGSVVPVRGCWPE
jgi:Carboxyl transferase domain